MSVCLSVEDVAMAFHEWERAYRMATGGNQLEPWDETTAHNQETGISFVKELLAAPQLTPRLQHEIWRSWKADRGWTYGKEYCRERRTNPCMVPWEKMPRHKQLEAEMMVVMVRTMAPLVRVKTAGGQAGTEEDSDPGSAAGFPGLHFPGNVQIQYLHIGS